MRRFLSIDPMIPKEVFQAATPASSASKTPMTSLEIGLKCNASYASVSVSVNFPKMSLAVDTDCAAGHDVHTCASNMGYAISTGYKAGKWRKRTTEG